MTIRRFIYFALCGLPVLVSTPALAGESVIWAFQGYEGSGSAPKDSIILSKTGIIYGTGSGIPGFYTPQPGGVFQLQKTPKGWQHTSLYHFQSGLDGAEPFGGVIEAPNGKLFGTTLGGGKTRDPSNGQEFQDGTVFELVPPQGSRTNWIEKVLYRFPSTDINQPTGSLILGKGGVLFGTASSGGPANAGGVFELLPPPKGQKRWTEKTLYAFKGGTDGKAPWAALLMDSSGALYGTTSQGGGNNKSIYCTPGGNVNGCGTVFKLTPPAKATGAWSETVLYAFTGGADGAVPYCTLVADSAGNLYGTTAYGGIISSGVVFKMSPPSAGNSSWTETTIYRFPGIPGSQGPMAGVVLGADGALYGTTYGGGPQGKGDAFQLIPPQGGSSSWTEKLIYSFQGFPGDGAHPVDSPTLDSVGDIFGTTLQGGSYNNPGYGTVFEITP
jgi:hypothetical protein